MRRRFISVFAILLTFMSVSVFADIPGSLDSNFDDIEIDNVLRSVDGVTAPFVDGDYAVFTVNPNARYVGIAFDFENFRDIHKFQHRVHYDEEYNKTTDYYVYVLKLPKSVQSIRYRLVIDGLWTTDPNNSNTVYDYNAGLVLSELDAGREIPIITEENTNGIVRFVYKGEKGQQIRLGGSFTNWDSWIYTLTEITPGLYQIDLPLPPGTYQYNYYCGITALVDTTNPTKCYTADGKVASLIIVN